MSRFCILMAILVLACGVQASWYWPFGSDDHGEKPPRISELMEPASLLIDEAADLAADGKASESVEKYRQALAELDRIEMENPERAKSAEFATLRNKRAYVNAAIDSMLLSQVKTNAKAVAVSDTTELERKLAEERAAKSGKPAKAAEPEKPAKAAEPEKTAKAEAPAPQPTRPPTRREQAIDCIARGDYGTAERLIADMLKEKPNGAMALNLRAALEMRQGRTKDAERTLDQAIMSNPRNYFAYYNMARLMLQSGPDGRSAAKRYYETGRAFGGPADAQLEAALK